MRSALESLIEKTRDGSPGKPDGEAEVACYELLKIIDHVAGHVPMSVTRKKYQRSEIKSLIIAKGAPVFFITFCPADVKSPLCMHYCGYEIDNVGLLGELTEHDMMRAVARNPVAAAKFFNFMVELFITVVLGVIVNLKASFGVLFQT